MLEDPARACAALLLGASLGGGHLVLAGGSTPKAAYEELARAVRAVGLDCGRVTLWFGDERCVPPEDERSNYQMVKRALLDPLAEGGSRAGGHRPVVRRMKGELGPDDGAAEYERELGERGPEQFGLVLLGMGPDGHTASLFPDQASLSEDSRMVVGVQEAGLEPFVPRLTFTLPALSRARRVVFLVAGEEKAQAVARAFGPGARPDPHVPSSLLPPLAGELTVLLDPAAASRL